MPNERWLRIIPVAFIMYTIAFIDRTNISMALPSLSRELHMDPAQAGDAAGVFFWGYMLLQIPGGYLAQRWSAKRFVSILLVLWGICSVACGLVQNGRQFWVMRFLLGVAEGGVWPATLVLLSHWFPRGERARANAFWMLCLPVAVVVSSPVSGWILAHWDWRVLLVAEGALPFLWLLIWWWFIDDHPHQAAWISPEERDHLMTTLENEASRVERVSLGQLLRALLNPQVLAMVAIYFLLNCGNYGSLFWLPSALENAKQMGHILVGVLNAIPYFITGIGMVVISRHSDKTRERRRHVALALAWGSIFLLACVLTSRQAPALSFVFVALVGAGSYGMLGPFWAIPTETLPAAVAGSAMGMVNAFGNLGGYVGPRVVGLLNQRTGNFMLGFGLLSGAYLVGSLLTTFLRQTPSAVRDGPSAGLA